MNLTEYLNQAEPKRKPIVNLSPSDYQEMKLKFQWVQA